MARKKMTKAQRKVGTVLREFKRGKLHSGKRGPGKGPVVTNYKQAVAIAMREANITRKK